MAFQYTLTIIAEISPIAVPVKMYKKGHHGTN